jgi:fatty-acyl-CoA synthase
LGVECCRTGFLGERVARYKLPRRWVFLEALPRTALGKVQKAVLARQLVEGTAG